MGERIERVINYPDIDRGMNAVTAVRQIEQDFTNRTRPFDDVQFPEERFLEEVSHSSLEDRARLVSAFATFDYNRNASQLVDNLIELYDRYHRVTFDPWSVTGSNSDEEWLQTEFEDIGFRYPNRDGRAWHKNCEILREQYSGKWTELYLTVGADAVELVEQIRDDGFLVLGGVKVAPMYARIIDNHVCRLSNVWELDIPVDTWIRKISQEIVDESMTDDEIREWWRMTCSSTDVDRHIIDGALWLIGNNMNDWGEDYLKRVLDADSLTYV
jgi:hypothetical protein